MPKHEYTRLTIDQGWVLAIAFSRDGKHIIAGGGSVEGTGLWRAGEQKGRLNQWNTATLEFERTIGGLPEYIRSLAAANTSDMLAVGFKSGGVGLVGQSWKRFYPLALTHEEGDRRETRIEALSFSPDDEYVAAGFWDFMARLWNRKQRELLWISGEHESHVEQVFFFECNRLLTCSHRYLRLYDIATGKCLTEKLNRSSHENTWSFCLSSDRKTLLSVGDGGTLRFWDTGDWLRRDIRKKFKNVSAIASASQSDRFAIGLDDGRLLVGSFASRGIIESWRVPSACAVELAFSPDGRTLICHDSGMLDSVLVYRL